MSELEEPSHDQSGEAPEESSVPKYIIEAVLGLLIGALVVWVLIVSVSDVEFIYQGF